MREIKKTSNFVDETAQATVSFSRAWKDGLSSGDAYWVFPNQVKKGAPTGQYLPKGSFVIEGKRNFCKGVELKLSIGLIQIENSDIQLSVDRQMLSEGEVWYLLHCCLAVPIQ